MVAIAAATPAQYSLFPPHVLLCCAGGSARGGWSTEGFLSNTLEDDCSNNLSQTSSSRVPQSVPLLGAASAFCIFVVTTYSCPHIPHRNTLI